MMLIQKTRPTIALAVSLLVIDLAGGVQPAWGQSNAPGTYEVTVKIAGTETGGETRRVAYKADVKMNIPVTDSNESRAIINISDVDEPSAMVTITQWDLEERNTHPNSAGQIMSWKCRLTAPVTVPMMAAGMLNLNYSRQTYSMFVALAGEEGVPLSCVHTGTGAYTTEEYVSFFFGTTELDTNPHDTLSFKDPTRIAAKFTLVPKGEMKGQYLPQEQEWALLLKK